jgi:hypothetical protein
VNFLLPPRTRGEGWGGVKNLRLLQGLLYRALVVEMVAFSSIAYYLYFGYTKT